MIAAAWIIGSTVPVAFAAVFLFGCCVLPFHRVLHRMFPLCHMATHVLTGSRDESAADHHPATPPPQKQQVSARSLLTILTAKQSLGRSDSFAVLLPKHSAVSHRNFITLGAIRCDQDIGLHRMLIDTFRI